MDWAAAAQMLIAIGSLVLSAAVFYYTKKTVALESLRSVRNSWMQLDQTALSDAANLLQADALFFNDAGDERRARRRWISMMALNPVVSDYMAACDGLLPNPKQTIEGCRVMLKQLLQHDDVYAMTQSGAYAAASGFAKLCYDIRADLPPPCA